jgi:hypothetical protein
MSEVELVVSEIIETSCLITDQAEVEMILTEI